MYSFFNKIFKKDKGLTLEGYENSLKYDEYICYGDYPGQEFNKFMLIYINKDKYTESFINNYMNNLDSKYDICNCDDSFINKNNNLRMFIFDTKIRNNKALDHINSYSDEQKIDIFNTFTEYHGKKNDICYKFNSFGICDSIDLLNHWYENGCQIIKKYEIIFECVGNNINEYDHDYDIFANEMIEDIFVNKFFTKMTINDISKKNLEEKKHYLINKMKMSSGLKYIGMSDNVNYKKDLLTEFLNHNEYQFYECYKYNSSGICDSIDLMNYWYHNGANYKIRYFPVLD